MISIILNISWNRSTSGMDIAREYLDKEISLSWALLIRMSRTEIEISKRNSRNAIETIRKDDLELEERRKLVRCWVQTLGLT